MQSAIAAVEQRGESIRCATEQYGIPHSTLHNHISGKVDHGSKPGRDPYLSFEEEEEVGGKNPSHLTGGIKSQLTVQCYWLCHGSLYYI